MNFDIFLKNLNNIKNRVDQSCKLVKRNPDSVSILPVTKTHPVWAVEYCLKAEINSVGENRVQEVRVKKPLIKMKCHWELIGHLQSNKVNEAVRYFDRIQSVDSIKLIRKLDQSCAKIEKHLPILLQCNSGDDPNKYGFRESEMSGALDAVLNSKNLKCDGLMTIAPLDSSKERTSNCFKSLRHISESLVKEFQYPLKELSMGMTNDLEVAIAQGSTMIRVGTALFGHRA